MVEAGAVVQARMVHALAVLVLAGQPLGRGDEDEDDGDGNGDSDLTI